MGDELRNLKLESEMCKEDDAINHPSHYTNRKHECIDEMVTIFGKKAVINFCICNAWKYRYRADSKGQHDSDMKKADWYISKAMELKGYCDDSPFLRSFIKK